MKNKYLFSVSVFMGLGLLTLLAFSACKTAKSAAVKLPEDFALKIQRTACFGTCPIFVMTIDRNGQVVYEGERFVKNVGKFTKKLTPEQFKLITSELQKNRLDTLKSSYDNPGLSDLPSLVITHTENGKTKRIVCRYKCPGGLTGFVTKVESTVGDEGFTAVPAEPKK